MTLFGHSRLSSVGRGGCDPHTGSMTLFSVHRREQVSLVIEAEPVVAEAGWWVFRTVDGQPLALIPTTEVLGIKAVRAGASTWQGGH